MATQKKKKKLKLRIIVTVYFSRSRRLIQSVSFIRLKNQKKPFEELHTKLEVGNQVLLANGFYGKVSDLKKDVAMVEIAPKVNVKVSRFAIQSIVEEK